MPSAETTRSRAHRRVVVIGGGIAGAEAALTLSLGLPDAVVTLIGRWPSIRVLPDLVYVPFGVSPRRIDLPLEALQPHGVRGVVAEIERVDSAARVVHTSVGPIEYDVLVAAPGAEPRERSHQSLRTLDDALRIQRDLDAIVRAALDGERRTITLRASSEDSWTAPGCELAILIGAWLRAMRVDNRVETLLATSDAQAFEWFGPQGEEIVDAALRRARVKLITGVPAGRFDELEGDLVIEFGAMQARRIAGLPGYGPFGWYEPDSTFAVAEDTYVIGDAIKLPYRAGFATAWQARHVLRALGGDPLRLGLNVDGIPSDSVEYQMDLADGVLRARIEYADTLARPFLGHLAEIEVAPGRRPDKLLGLVLHDRVLRWEAAAHDAPLAYRDLLTRREVA